MPSKIPSKNSSKTSNKNESLKNNNSELKYSKNSYAALLESDTSDNEKVEEKVESTVESTVESKVEATIEVKPSIVKLEEVLNLPPENTVQINNTNNIHNIDNNDSNETKNAWTNIVKTTNTDKNNNKMNKFKSNKYDDKILEHKEIFDENQDYGDIGNDLKLNSHWTMWLHQTDNNDWTLHGYQKRYVINSIGSFWRCFNNFQFFDLYKNQIFIMRDEIAPIWEDVNNKFGGICSIKIESTQRGFKTDISTEIFVSICMLIMNETLIASNDTIINGISYAVRKKNILIKLWTRTFYEDNKFIEELPKTLINKFNSELQRHLIGTQFENSYKMSIQYKKIKPEYEL